MKKALIVSGGNIEEDFALLYLKRETFDYRIAADRGLLFLQRHSVCPDSIVGDFDSASDASLEQYLEDPRVTVRRFRPEKDWTDTEIAVETALELGCESIDILGGTGSRLDHVFGNVQVLALALERGADCCLIDSHNKIYLKDRPFSLERSRQWGNYLSLFPYGGEVTGLTLQGVKYPVENFTLGTVGSRGVSNEITEDLAQIRFRTGKLLVVESSD